MLLRLLWFLAIGLFLNFVYRLVVATIRFLSRDSDSRAERNPPASQPPPKQDRAEYRDVKDAQFRDLPPGPDNPS